MGTSAYRASSALTAMYSSCRRKEIWTTLRSRKASAASGPPCKARTRKHVSDTTASQVSSGDRRRANCAVTQSWYWFRRLRNATQGPVSRRTVCSLTIAVQDIPLCREVDGPLNTATEILYQV